MTVRLPRTSGPRRPERNGGTIIALFVMLGMGGGLLALVSMVMPQAAGLLAVILGFAAFIALHYFTWGRWLINMSRQQADSDDTQRETSWDQDNWQPPRWPDDTGRHE